MAIEQGSGWKDTIRGIHLAYSSCANIRAGIVSCFASLRVSAQICLILTGGSLISIFLVSPQTDPGILLPVLDPVLIS